MNTQESVQETSQEEASQTAFAHRAGAMEAVKETRANLSRVVVDHEVHTDSHGNVLTEREVNAIAHGETAYKK